MFARLKIVTALHRDALVVPRRAPATEDGKHVWIVKDEGARMVKIETGLVDEKGIEVLSGISPDDQVIVDGQSALTSKSKIVVKDFPDKGPAETSGETRGEAGN
jgi:multidrug efflux pump subunit AcrA (membrane-fusion protein)